MANDTAEKAQEEAVDVRAMEHFAQTGELLPEVRAMSRDQLSELLGYANAPAGFDAAIRAQRECL